MRTLVIGDIHGCYRELLELLDVCALGSDDVVVSVGDLVDRGPEPGEVVRWFRQRPGAVVLMGNHERKHVRSVLSYSQEVTRLQLGAAYADDVAWMRTLPYYLETPEIRVVHAALVPGVPLAQQDEAVLAGTTSGEGRLRALFPEGWWHERYEDAVPVAFGHHVTGPEPLVREGRVYGLDTGACHGMRLTALSLPDLRLYSVPARPDSWSQVARRFQVPVLRTRPWATLSWAKLDAALAEQLDDRVSPGEDTVAYLGEVSAWARAIRGLHTTLLARVPVLAEELRAAGLGPESHPAKALLHKLARGRLTLDDIMVRAPTPAATLALAAALGVPPPASAPPGAAGSGP